MYGSEIEERGRIFCHFGSFFALLTPPTINHSKNQHFEKKEKKAFIFSRFQNFDFSGC